MTDGRDDEIVFLTGCRDHASVPTSLRRPEPPTPVEPPPPPLPRRVDPVIIRYERDRRPHRAGVQGFDEVDLALVVAALVLAMAAVPCVAPRLLPAPGRAGHVVDYVACAAPLGIAASFALAASRLRRLRDHSTSPIREPGFVAAAMVALTACICLIRYVARGLLYDIHIEYYCSEGPLSTACKHPGWVAPDPHYLEAQFLRDMASGCGLAVAVAWIVLAISGRWNARADWIDRAGCALGVGWFVASVASLI
jgi:hypothetical protein